MRQHLVFFCTSSDIRRPLRFLSASALRRFFPGNFAQTDLVDVYTISDFPAKVSVKIEFTHTSTLSSVFLTFSGETEIL